MLPIRTLVKRVRLAVNDSNTITYGDDEALYALNNGIRYIRRTIAALRPELIASEKVTGMLKAGENSIMLPRRPLAFLYVKVGDEIKSRKETYLNHDKIYHNHTPIFGTHTLICSKTEIVTYFYYKVPEVNLHAIDGDAYEQGRPEVFYRIGERELLLYPVPEKETAYEVRPIDDLEEVTLEDDSPLLTEFDDVLVEYAVLRLQIRNEYDVSQEASVQQTIYAQIMNLLGGPPPGVQVDDYWHPAGFRHNDYRYLGR